MKQQPFFYFKKTIWKKSHSYFNILLKNYVISAKLYPINNLADLLIVILSTGNTRRKKGGGRREGGGEVAERGWDGGVNGKALGHACKDITV